MFGGCVDGDEICECYKNPHNVYNVRNGAQPRQLEIYNIYAELISIVAYQLFMRIFALVKRRSGEIEPADEIMLAIDDPLWQ
jgi:hypothetical protein